ncbi:MFS transporter [Pantoea sp. BAV 3049]|uniref:MFS transporter n=1 Tax=Pantoea sp. BAV 3049 TaxID=2654188 RepID=UPI00131D8C63|nr:MFS transporter [Pantoea sp. BAV 3049]
MALTLNKQNAVIDKYYTVYLIVIACVGWSLASYDVNLLVLALPEMSKEMAISEQMLGVLGFFVYGSQFLITLIVGYSMDRVGRKLLWMICLCGTAIFTGATYFVDSFWQLVLVRALASGLAYSELAVSITLVNEQLPSKNRGLLYSIVQGGWPLGVFFASAVYMAFGHYGWRVVFLLGTIPIAIVIVGRIFIKESDRFEENVQSQGEARVNPIRMLFGNPLLKRRLLTMAVCWISYGISYVASNFYITWWLTQRKGFTGSQASELMLYCGFIGFFFYIIGGWLGEKFGRKKVITVAAISIAPLCLLLLLSDSYWLVVAVYFLIFQVTNGIWASAGYVYQSESFPTAVRGTAIGFLSSMMVSGFVLGSLLWTLATTLHSTSATWIIVAVVGSLGMWFTLLLKDIKTGQDIDAEFKNALG